MRTEPPPAPSAWRPGLAEATVDVVGGPRVLRVVEDDLRRAVLDDHARRAVGGEEEGAPVGDPGGLLHVVGDDHDRHGGGDLLDRLLDDAALAAGRYLCHSGDLSRPEVWRQAIYSFNHSYAYVVDIANLAVSLVLTWVLSAAGSVSARDETVAADYI